MVTESNVLFVEVSRNIVSIVFSAVTPQKYQFMWTSYYQKEDNQSIHLSITLHIDGIFPMHHKRETVFTTTQYMEWLTAYTYKAYLHISGRRLMVPVRDRAQHFVT